MIDEIQQRLGNGEHPVKYSYGPYNKVKGDEQWIRIFEGCIHNCPYCYETDVLSFFGVPEIVRNKVGIMDMNFLCHSEALTVLYDLPMKLDGKNIVYDFLCGIDYRFLTYEIAEILKQNLHLKKVRIAWDWYYKDQFKIHDACKLLEEAGFKKNQIMIFMICNWKIPYKENLQKLDLLKIWNYQVADCYYDNQVGPQFHPVHWKMKEIKDFRRRCRKHNQLVNFQIDPELSIKGE